MTETPDIRPRETGPQDRALLDAAFGAARADAARPAPGDLMARIVADAARESDSRATARPGRAGRRPGRLAQIAEALGGWAGVGGLATAAAAGLWLGIAPPAAVEAEGGWFGAATAETADVGTVLPADYFDLSGEG